MPTLSVDSPKESTTTYTLHPNPSNSLVFDIGLIILIIWCILNFKNSFSWVGFVIVIIWIKLKCGVVLSETILAVRGLGIQLSTTRGLSIPIPSIFCLSPPVEVKSSSKQSAFTIVQFPISTANTFLPLESILDVVINEGISNWQIIFYLVIIQDQGREGVKLRIGFPESLPRLPIVKETWIGIRKVIFEEDNIPILDSS